MKGIYSNLSNLEQHQINLDIYHCTIEQPQLFTPHEIDFYSKYYNSYLKMIANRQQAQTLTIDDMLNS